MSNTRAVTHLMRQVRSFSTTNSNKALEKAPIQLFGLEGRYAHAIYSAAVKQNQLNAVDKDFQAIKNLLNQHKGVITILKNPTLSKEEKQHAVNALADKKSASQVTVNALNLMSENGRLGRLNGIVNAFDKIMSAHKGEVTATVTTAKPLDKSQIQDLQATLQAFLKQGNKLNLELKTNPSIIGGMIVEIGDRYVDMSISSRVNAYTQLIKESV